VGAVVTIGVHIGAAFQPVTPAGWATDSSCTPAYDEQHGTPAGPATTPSLTETSLTVNPPAEAADLEAVVQAVCPGGSPKLVLSADDIREAGRDLSEFDVPSGFDLSRLSVAEPVYATVGIASDGTFSLKGIASDQGAGGADDASQGQGSLAGK
jgi:hypothetical protein